MDVGNIPLFWLAAFREADIQTRTINDDDGEPVKVTAPVTAVSSAIQNLENAREPLKAAFPEQVHLDGYISFMKEALSSAGFPYVTLELVEIESMMGEGQFRSLLHCSLAGFDQPAAFVEVRREKQQSLWKSLFGKSWVVERHDWRWSLVQMSDVRDHLLFPEADLFFHDRDYLDDELWNHCRLLGDILYRPVPWNPYTG